MTSAALLFCPGDRPDRFARAVSTGARVILDLEDAVAADHKHDARDAVREQLRAETAGLVVRINAAGTPWYERDLAMVRAAGAATVMLPKAEDPDRLEDLGNLKAIALCESAKGVLAAARLAEHPACAGLMWGVEDLVADLGGRSSRRVDGTAQPLVEHVRSTVLLAAAAAGKDAVDGVWLDLLDVEGLAEQARNAATVGFAAKACIHPDQVPVVDQAFAPSDSERRWAHDVLARAASEHGVFRHQGRMIDGPLLSHARSILERTL